MIMFWKPSPSGSDAVYIQICRHYEEQIRSGLLPPGSKLPAERDLALRLAVNRSTVQAAYGELRALGLVQSRPGSGTSVSDSMWEQGERQPDWIRYLSRRYNPSSRLQEAVNEAPREGVIDLTQGELHRSLMPLELMERLSGELDWSRPFSYRDDPQGDCGLREALASHPRIGPSLAAKPDELLLTGGVKHSLGLIARAMLEPGDAVAVEGPSYLYAMGVFAAAGIYMVRLPVDKEGLTPEAIPELYRRHRIRLVVTNPTFQNPTGSTLSLARRLQLLAICTELRLPIIEDDPYSLLGRPGWTALPSLRSLPGGRERVLSCGTFSKIATPGMRTGWIAAPRALMAALMAARHASGLTTSHPGERLGAALLGSGQFDTRLETVRAALERRRQAAAEAAAASLAPHAAIQAALPEGGFYIWLKHGLARSGLEVLQECMEQGVAVSPGELYGERPGWMRISVATAEEDMIAEGIRRAAAALERLAGKECHRNKNNRGRREDRG
ncbi:Uncharacterized HTH-type transcriptional regulator YdfD [Paenibacillus sp. P22]|nr:Uncharacterized HTH-type transcriptional regulator YdfD [Paenibacillus sp. P22]